MKKFFKWLVIGYLAGMVITAIIRASKVGVAHMFTPELVAWPLILFWHD